MRALQFTLYPAVCVRVFKRLKSNTVYFVFQDVGKSRIHQPQQQQQQLRPNNSNSILSNFVDRPTTASAVTNNSFPTSFPTSVFLWATRAILLLTVTSMNNSIRCVSSAKRT